MSNKTAITSSSSVCPRSFPHQEDGSRLCSIEANRGMDGELLMMAAQKTIAGKRDLLPHPPAGVLYVGPCLLILAPP